MPSEKIVGEFKFLNSSKEKIKGSETFLTFEYKGEHLALPVVFKNEKQKKLAYQNKESLFVIEANIEETKLDLDGEIRSLRLLKISRIQKLNFSDFSYQGPLASQEKKQGSSYNPQGIKVNKDVAVMKPNSDLITITGINDKLTNTAIGVGAAVMLFKLLKK